MKAPLCFLATMALLAGVQSGLASDADLEKLAVANNDFAFKLVRQLAAEQRGANLFISPYSAATALQMVGNGAAGQTRAEMQLVLGTGGLAPNALNGACRAVANSLRSADTHLILTTANSLWYRQGVAINARFTNTTASFFDATVRALDFSNPRAAEAEINQWSSQQTHGRIQGIADGLIDPYTDLILANAIYFKGKWDEPFDVKLTKARLFHSANGSQKSLPMMEMSKSFMYRKGSGYQAVRLPYMGYDLAMYVFLPDRGSSPEMVLQILNGDKWRRVTMPGFETRDGTVVLPKFKLEYAADFNPPLKALGLKTVFEPKQADLSGIFSDPHSISEVRQKAFIEVNEEGTEAAAATAIGIPAGGMDFKPPPPFKMIVDRPFLFAIVDGHSDMILFIGLINEL